MTVGLDPSSFWAGVGACLAADAILAGAPCALLVGCRWPGDEPDEGGHVG